MIPILVIEDNHHLRRIMAMHLEHAGFRVLQAEHGRVALDIIRTEPVSIITLDLMMPVMDGFAFLKALQGMDTHIATLVISASGTAADKQLALALGADGYMVKPVEMADMLVHLDLLLHERGLSRPDTVTVGGTALHEDTLTTCCQGVVTHLSQKEFMLLRLLLTHPGRIFTRQSLAARAGDLPQASEVNLVDIRIRRLQHLYQANGDFAIEAVHGLGYRAMLR